MNTIPINDTGIDSDKSLITRDAFLNQLKNESLEKREKKLVRYLKYKIGNMLHLRDEEIAIEQYLMYLGMDSLIFLRLMESLAGSLLPFF